MIEIKKKKWNLLLAFSPKIKCSKLKTSDAWFSYDDKALFYNMSNIEE